MKSIDTLARLLVIVGGVNWGLVGLFGFDLVAALFGPMSVMSRIVYTLVGLSAVYDLVQFNAITRRSAEPHAA
jgi:uncharacterized membrane protein YuzA (DUF378 family)